MRLTMECPHCAGEGYHKDYWGEYSDCECCNPNGKKAEGRAWFWTLWRYKFFLWRQDRMYARMMRGSETEV